ncbi:ferritin-like domain-containing protein [Blastococcus sp. TML/M2B]|uniref:ferritin-like domain-containing protein n=1 Tax=unclassified Blastococcus TaxID=2619396 RepID=UPI00190DBC08|nr:MULTISPECIES: ferritin-like domain-containing protein [unclassified Blastococcus]MBN1093293.1 ferritin-like domain-containing protein [Blastococcus sp. TML/M2B]MBN1096594.1 ferritin-like domain-containing protein [Blastococcus sp. TML/C7B]
MTDATRIQNQLRALVLLTQTEEQIARTRISQARTDAVRRELVQNADNAAARTVEITEALRAAGGVPDVVTPAIGRLSAVLKATVEQAAPLEEALLTDLQLEHQLVDRATYLKVLAEKAGATEVRRLAEKLVDAHTATVEWLTVVLAEEALGGPAALVATPLQKVAGTVARAAGAPVRFVHNTVNTALDSVQQAGEETTERLGAVADRAAALTGAVGETLTVSRAAGLRRAERIARREGEPEAAAAARAAREELGDLTADELPIPGYDSMAVADAVKAIKKLTTPHDVNVVIRYEETHKKRSNVASAAQTRLADLAKEAVGVSS